MLTTSPDTQHTHHRRTGTPSPTLGALRHPVIKLQPGLEATLSGMFPFFLLNLCLPFPLPLILPVELPGLLQISSLLMLSVAFSYHKKKKKRKEKQGEQIP